MFGNCGGRVREGAAGFRGNSFGAKRALLVAVKGGMSPASVARLLVSRTRCSASSACTAEPGPITPAQTRQHRLLGPGSAAHHSANAPCCAAHGTRHRILPRSRGAISPELLEIRRLTLETEGAGKAGCRLTP